MDIKNKCMFNAGVKVTSLIYVVNVVHVNKLDKSDLLLIGNLSLAAKKFMEALGHRYYRSLGALCRNRRIQCIDDLIGWAMLPVPLAFSHVIYFCSQ